MAEEGEISEQKGETLMKKKVDDDNNKIDAKNDDTTSSSSSSSDSDDEKKARKKSPVATASSPSPPERGNKSKIYRLFGREMPVHNVFGGGKPADVFLWRNKKISASVIGGATVVWVLFEILGYHLITLICHILIVALAILFLWSNVSTFINKSPPRFPEVYLPEGPFLHVASVLRIEINQTFAVLREIASGRDLKKFLGVIAGLWVLSVVGGWCNFLTLFYITFVLLHTVPVLYEKYEDKIDPIAEKGIIEMKKQYAVFNAKVLSKIPRGPSKEKKTE